MINNPIGQNSTNTLFLLTNKIHIQLKGYDEVINLLFLLISTFKLKLRVVKLKLNC